MSNLPRMLRRLRAIADIKLVVLQCDGTDKALDEWLKAEGAFNKAITDNWRFIESRLDNQPKDN